MNTPDEVCQVGDTVKAEVISVDQDARKLGLSVRLATLREQSGDLKDYVAKSGTSKTSIGDLFGDQLKDLQGENKN